MLQCADTPLAAAPASYPPPRRQLFTGTASEKRVVEELMGYSDYSLHAFCYNSGPAFAEYRLNTKHLMTSTKFEFLARLLPKLKVRAAGLFWAGRWRGILGQWGSSKTSAGGSCVLGTAGTQCWPSP